jgi:hypothetical protein
LRYVRKAEGLACGAERGQSHRRLPHAVYAPENRPNEARKESMRSQIEFALLHPVFDPARQIVTGHYWRAGDTVSACLTVNIGME